jgi:hypothetical protein
MKLGCLNERAVMCKGWRWLPGMLTMDEVRIYAVEGDTFDGFDDDSEYNDHPVSALEWPDLTDPATLGCLLALVRKAWGCSGMATMQNMRCWEVWQCQKCSGKCFDGFGATEAEALVDALEAAP